MNFISREDAWSLLCAYNKEPFHLLHARTVEAVMRWFSVKLGYDEEADFWATVGLLHDLDFEQYPNEHCVKCVEIMRDKALPEPLIHAVVSHGYGLVCDVAPEHEMEKVLFAVDELTGLIGAAALMRPSKSVQDMELKSLVKKFKDKKFAAGCNREVIGMGAERLGWSLERLLQETLDAMRAVESSLQ
ncbi:MAG: hydrolase [Oscillospiraceae bacterium]